MTTKELNSTFDVRYDYGTGERVVVVTAEDELGAIVDALSFLRHHQHTDPVIVSIVKRDA